MIYSLIMLPGAQALGVDAAATLVADIVEYGPIPITPSIYEWVTIPAVSQLSTDVFGSLLKGAVDKGDCVLAMMLSDVPSAGELSSAEVHVLLESACKAWPSSASSVLAGLGCDLGRGGLCHLYGIAHDVLRCTIARRG